MPLTKVTGKTRGANQSRTHAHYAGEFGATRQPGKQIDQVGAGTPAAKSVDGSKRLSKENSKDPAYRAARAEHFAKEAQKAHADHAAAKTPEEKLKHEAILAHAAQRAGVHARFVTKNQPGSALADEAVKHAHIAQHLHQDAVTKKTDAKEAEKEKKADEKKAAEKKEQAAQKEKDRQERTQHLAEMKKQKEEAKAHAAEAKKQADEAKRHAEETRQTADSVKKVLEEKNSVSDKEESPGEKATKMAYEMRHTSDMINAHLMDGDKDKAEKLYLKLKDQHDAFSAHFAKHQEAINRYENFESEHDIMPSHAKTYKRDIDAKIDSSVEKRTHDPGAMSAAKYVKESLEFKNNLTNEQFYALRNYSNHTDKILNNSLRKNNGELDSKKDVYRDLAKDESSRLKRHSKQTEDTSVGREMHDLDSAISSHKLSEDTKVYRGLSDPDGKIMASLKVGGIFKDHGYVSTTADKRIMEQYAVGKNPIQMHISLKKGSSAPPMHELSTFRSEYERLLPRGSSFRVTKIESTPHHKIVHVEVE